MWDLPAAGGWLQAGNRSQQIKLDGMGGPSLWPSAMGPPGQKHSGVRLGGNPRSLAPLPAVPVASQGEAGQGVSRALPPLPTPLPGHPATDTLGGREAGEQRQAAFHSQTE